MAAAVMARHGLRNPAPIKAPLRASTVDRSALPSASLEGLMQGRPPVGVWGTAQKNAIDRVEFM
jgi:hypothetical protein